MESEGWNYAEETTVRRSGMKAKKEKQSEGVLDLQMRNMSEDEGKGEE